MNKNRKQIFHFISGVLFKYSGGLLFDYFRSDSNIQIDILTGKYLPEREMFYHYTANRYHTLLIIRIIRNSCIYFDGEIEKRRVAYLLN